ncbi:MAG: CvpA family protein [Planctomycetes bacterium]|nr:CvpA family protein [Planctomycetota bacterium]
MRDFLASLGPVDVGALIVVLFNLLMGLIRGFVWQFVRLGTIVAALCLARYGSADLAVWVQNSFSVGQPADRILAYFAIFFAVFIAGTLLAFLLRGVLATLRLQSFDRLLGALLGAVKGGAIVVVAVLLLARLRGVPALQDELAVSHAARLSAAVVERIDPFFPDTLGEEFTSWLEEIRSRLPAPAPAPAPPR